MTLKKLLKNIDKYTQIIIWDQVSTVSPEWDIVYSGIVSDVPWWMVEGRKLINTEDNEGAEAIATFIDEETGLPCIRITLADEVDWDE